ncbi:hypothetical protein [Shewanella marina]|uniref:hypothetical protein n=1 Tax=Shewanella marina TaxID=487319 RepID=UPI00046F490C|nr:hypothetical protein [Shewanella marina]
MHHCGNTLYIKDKFCCQCGEELNGNRHITQLSELHPHLLDELAQSKPNPTLFTGQVKSTYHYKRGSRNGNNKISYSYWWVTLENPQGQTKQINFEAENKTFDNIKVGDVLTTLEPTNVTLTYPFENKSDRDIVTNNHLAPGVVLHQDDGQTYTLSRTYNVDKPSFINHLSGGAIFGAIVAIILAFNTSMSTDGLFALAVLIAFMTALPFYLFEKNSFQKAVILKSKIKTVLETVLNVSQYQLGYHKLKRPSLADDVMCHQCDHRVHADINFCPLCGTNQRIFAITDANQTDIINCDGNTALSIEAIAPIPRKTIAEMRLDKMNEFYLSDKGSFEYQHLLSVNEKFDGSCWCYMVQVTDRKFTTTVNDVIHSTTYRTEYTNRYGRVVDSTERTESHRVRDSNLSGKITVEDEEGDIFEQWLPKSLLSHTDVGDYLLIGYSRLRQGEAKISYGEYYYNISKGRWNMPESVLSYGEISAMAKLWVFLAAVGAGYFAYQTNQFTVALSAFSLFFGVVAISSWHMAKRNRKAGRKLIQPIMDMLEKVKENKQEILAYFAKLK